MPANWRRRGLPDLAGGGRGAEQEKPARTDDIRRIVFPPWFASALPDNAKMLKVGAGSHPAVRPPAPSGPVRADHLNPERGRARLLRPALRGHPVAVDDPRPQPGIVGLPGAGPGRRTRPLQHAGDAVGVAAKGPFAGAGRSDQISTKSPGATVTPCGTQAAGAVTSSILPPQQNTRARRMLPAPIPSSGTPPVRSASRPQVPGATSAAVASSTTCPARSEPSGTLLAWIRDRAAAMLPPSGGWVQPTSRTSKVLAASGPTRAEPGACRSSLRHSCIAGSDRSLAANRRAASAMAPPAGQPGVNGFLRGGWVRNGARCCPPSAAGPKLRGQVVEEARPLLALELRHAVALAHPGQRLVPALAAHRLVAHQPRGVAGGAEIEHLVAVRARPGSTEGSSSTSCAAAAPASEQARQQRPSGAPRLMLRPGWRCGDRRCRRSRPGSSWARRRAGSCPRCRPRAPRPRNSPRSAARACVAPALPGVAVGRRCELGLLPALAEVDRDQHLRDRRGRRPRRGRAPSSVARAGRRRGCRRPGEVISDLTGIDSRMRKPSPLLSVPGTIGTTGHAVGGALHALAVMLAVAQLDPGQPFLAGRAGPARNEQAHRARRARPASARRSWRRRSACAAPCAFSSRTPRDSAALSGSPERCGSAP